MALPGVWISRRLTSLAELLFSSEQKYSVATYAGSTGARSGCADLFHADKTEHMDEQETQYGFDITTIRRKMSGNS